MYFVFLHTWSANDISQLVHGNILDESMVKW